MSGDLQQEKKDHVKHEHEEDVEYTGPATPARSLSVGDPPPPPAVDLPGPGSDVGDNGLLSTIEPASFDAVAPDSSEAGGGGGSSGSDTGGGSGGGSGGGGDGGGKSTSTKK